jgi:Dpy-30 motif
MILLPETAKTLPLGQPLLFYLLEINTPEFSATQLDTIDSLIYFSKTDEETEVFVSALFPGRKHTFPLHLISIIQLSFALFCINLVERTMIRSNAETQTYLNEKIYPVLTKGLTFLCKEKPADPVQWLAQWLIRNNPDSAQVQVQL